MTPQDAYISTDIIAAEATPPGRGGISVIRLSGSGASDLVTGLFDRKMPSSGRHRFGLLLRKEGVEPIDEAVVMVFGAERSYTGEEVVEISTHGSPLVVAEVLEALYELGARPAKPGEFTLRAFMNGRMSLTQAEAVADLIEARSREAAQQAQKQLQGSLRDSADKISDDIARLLGYHELELDFVEDDVELAARDEKLSLLKSALTGIEGMLKGYQASRRLRKGVKVVIAGSPNVGKSSLFNALLDKERAIVHKSPGTTRDTIEGSCIIGGIDFELHDTAGIRDISNGVEVEGVKRAQLALQDADITLLVQSTDLPESEIPADDKSDEIQVMNKIDLVPSDYTTNCLPVSAKTGFGLDRLKEQLYRRATAGTDPDERSINRERHFAVVSRAQSALLEAKNQITGGSGGEIIAEHLREALMAFDQLSGRNRIAEVLDEIFNNFCIGK